MEQEKIKGYFPPHRVFGNLYFVGTEPASTHILDTGEGLIMFDSGYEHSLPTVLENMRELGLNPENIQWLLHTHGHIDHMGATHALVERYGMKTAIGKEDADYVTGVNDLTYAREFGMTCAFFQPDLLLSDGDIIRLGTAEITCVATPGHTPGAISYFFDITDGKKSFRAGLHAGSGLNTMRREYLEKYGLPLSLRADFMKAQERLSQIPVDVFLGNHMQQNGTAANYEKIVAGDPLAYVNKERWARFCLSQKAAVQEMLNKEAEQ